MSIENCSILSKVHVEKLKVEKQFKQTNHLYDTGIFISTDTFELTKLEKSGKSLKTLKRLPPNEACGP